VKGELAQDPGDVEHELAITREVFEDADKLLDQVEGEELVPGAGEIGQVAQGGSYLD